MNMLIDYIRRFYPNIKIEPSVMNYLERELTTCASILQITDKTGAMPLMFVLSKHVNYEGKEISSSVLGFGNNTVVVKTNEDGSTELVADSDYRVKLLTLKDLSVETSQDQFIETSYMKKIVDLVEVNEKLVDK